ncbi:YggS family pyridoxal phosphate-dependent enzyme [Candidatus Liberibacter sp.]|uniref:YggS family pyridoxal phosphate-dependent enzyme n=1 Tax=Candidatus Liberibacter sp. TaxID=34022 RepID=UPI0015F4EE79|nr:YggS family pyridoxal phosphate-dependent enzyme [Candidatus Liberibacter sp.]MBA5723959.1 YggS family pyridoxal phosphate-dependent enzyme [Candidatus Liberibacter sp.]
MILKTRLQETRNNILKSEVVAQRSKNSVSLVAVSKMVDVDVIHSALSYGQTIFAENKVKEAQIKWSSLKQNWNVELRFIGSLQSNKVPEVISLFDVIETVCRDKIASLLATEMEKQKRRLSIYIQVNTGNEAQKFGVRPKDTKNFFHLCQEKYGLKVEGLMCIPPIEENPGPHFCLLSNIARDCGLKKLSMGMTKDFGTAIAFGSTSVRIGSGIFGDRPLKCN